MSTRAKTRRATVCSTTARAALAVVAREELKRTTAGDAAACKRLLWLFNNSTSGATCAREAAGCDAVVAIVATIKTWLGKLKERGTPAAKAKERGVIVLSVRSLRSLLASCDESFVSAAVAAAAPRMLVSMLTSDECTGSERVAYQACRALKALSKTGAGAKACFQAGCVDGLTRCLDMHPCNAWGAAASAVSSTQLAQLATAALSALGRLLEGRDSAAVHAEALAAGCPEAAVKALRRVSWDDDEQCDGEARAKLGEASFNLLALLGLAGGCRCCGARPEDPEVARLESASALVREAGALRAAVDALMQERTPRRVLIAAARVLMAGAAADDDSALAVCRAGGARALVGAMMGAERGRDCIELQSLGCGALGDLAWRLPHFVRAAGGARAALRVLDHHAHERDVARRACAVLANLAESPERKLELCEAGAAVSLARMVRLHVRGGGEGEGEGEAAVLQAALRTLAALAAGCTQCERAICDAGGVGACVAALREHPHDQGVQEWGLGTLVNLAAGACADVCLRGGGAAVASLALGRGSLQAGARQAALRALAFMTPAAHRSRSPHVVEAGWCAAWAAAAVRVAVDEEDVPEVRGEALALLSALTACGAAAVRTVLEAGAADAAAAAMLALPSGHLAAVRNGHALLSSLLTGGASSSDGGGGGGGCGGCGSCSGGGGGGGGGGRGSGSAAVRAACARRLELAAATPGLCAPTRRTRSHDACAICLGTRDGPAAHMLTLACGHEFCAGCTQQHVHTRLVGSGCRCASCAKASMPECPLCRQEIGPAAIVGCLVWAHP